MTSSQLRIACISNECVDILIELGCGDLIVGVPNESGKRDLPNAARIGDFGNCSVTAINDLKPDIVIGSADIQTRTAADLIKAYHNVLITNQLDIAGIFSAIRMIGGIVDRIKEAEKMIQRMSTEIEGIHIPDSSQVRVYFEEWNDPYVTAARWISEMISIAGGIDVFSELSTRGFFLDREVSSVEVIAANPDVILTSWCGVPLDKESIKRRSGWSEIDAVANDRIYEIAPGIVLQPGPRIIDGIKTMSDIFQGIADA